MLRGTIKIFFKSQPPLILPNPTAYDTLPSLLYVPHVCDPEPLQILYKKAVNLSTLKAATLRGGS